jgi:eukaryotic-like serine/threonine-protein kinase
VPNADGEPEPGPDIDREAHDTRVGSSEDAATVAGKSPERERGTTITPDVALQQEELVRTRVFLAVSTALSLVLVPCTILLRGPLSARLVLLGCELTTAAGTSLLRYSLRKAENYTESRILASTCVTMSATALGVVFAGVFSPAPMVGSIGIYFLGQSKFRRVAFAAWIGYAVLYAIPSCAIGLGFMRDPGLFHMSGAALSDDLLVTVLVQTVYGLVFLLARGSRKAMVDAVEKLHSALAQVQKREALLAEAHNDLDRALAGGYHGRWSERQIGRYRLGPVIGRGAMSEIYRAAGVEDGRAVAVKVLNAELTGEGAHLRRFQREAEIIGKLRSRHVVKLYDVAIIEGGEQPSYLAMELLEGHDLAWVLRQRRRLPPDEVLELVDQVSDALAEAASEEIVHRDLKPQNLFVIESGSSRLWKVLDFGVSKLARSGTLTAGAIVGTPGYMAPEQARGDDVNTRADVFSLAAIAYRALTGRPAFAGRDMPRTLFDVCYVQPIQPSKLVPMSLDVERVLALGLAKDPNDRFATALEFARALRAAFDSTLDARLRERGEAHLARQPWGSRITEAA